MGQFDVSRGNLAKRVFRVIACRLVWVGRAGSANQRVFRVSTRRLRPGLLSFCARLVCHGGLTAHRLPVVKGTCGGYITRYPAVVPDEDMAVKRLSIPAIAMIALLAGCAEYKEYTYKEFSVSREQAYQSMTSILEDEGYPISEVDENYVNDLPEIYIETEFNLRQTGAVYRGANMRRKAYVTITTVYSERAPFEYQPLNELDGERLEEAGHKYEEEKKAGLEQTRIGIAVRLERKSDISRPLEADWYYDGPDNYESGALMGRFEAAWGESRKGGSTEPSAKGVKRKREELENR